MPLSAEKYATPTNTVDHLEQPDLEKAVVELKKNRDAFTWPQRRALVRSAVEQLDQVGPTEAAIAVLVLLTEDPKWEVRKDVADSLVFVPDDEFPRLAAKLARDTNAFVQKAAERALDRRRRGQQTAQKKRRNLDQLQEQYSTIEKMHGSIAADRARQMAERLYDVIVGATVHDMRNILSPLKSGITSLLGQLSDNGIAPKLFEKNLMKMGYQAAMLERLLEDMRAYSQSTPGERRRERLIDVVNEAHGMVMDTFQVTGRDASKVKVWIDVPENLTVEVSRYQIVRVVGNVLKNACESFADDPQTFVAGEVSLIARIVDGEFVEIIVRDNGMGLSVEELEEVRRFVPGGTSKKTHGTGFGLPIAKRKLEDHGGFLAIDSQEDAGTTVTITLPVEAKEGDE